MRIAANEHVGGCNAHFSSAGYHQARSHLTYGASVRPENAVTYSTGNEGRKICGYLTAFKSYAMKHERKSQCANYSDSFLRLTHSEEPEGTQRLTTFSLAQNDAY